jgi:lysophospholipase L1-like esterase
MRGHHGSRLRAAVLSVLTGAAVIASGSPGVAAVAGTGPATHGPAAWGTTAAKGPVSKNAAVQHAAVAAQDSTGDLSTVSSVMLNGDYTAAGIGMRNQGSGEIKITGVPDGATVKSATLLWDVLADQASATFAQGTVDGSPITGTSWASGSSPCWPVSANFSYEADVTSLVTGNGSYALAGFATGDSDGADPWTDGSDPPLLEGASLVVIYQKASLPQSVIQIAEGASETEGGDPATATMSGFTAPASPAVKATYIVADGQLAGNTATFNGTSLPDVSFPGADPQAAPAFSQGDLWDTVTTDVSDQVDPGDTSADLSVMGSSDCLVWVGQVLDVASSGSVLGLGDSVTAGYGLGPSEGDHDNPSAYPLVLAKQLGIPGDDEAVEGACASSAGGPFKEFDCQDRDSLATQIQDVPDDQDPSLITLSIGADDIDFSACIRNIMFYDKSRLVDPQPDLDMTSPLDPCSARRLNRALASFSHNFETDLNAIKDKFPDASVQVMNYYDPFPAAPASAADTCELFSDATLANKYAEFDRNWEAVAGYYFHQHQAYLRASAQTQAKVADDAGSILDDLNGAIGKDVEQAAANGLDATVVDTSDIDDHGVCAGNAAWLFTPTGKLSLHLFGFTPFTYNFGSGQPVCTDASDNETGNEPSPVEIGTRAFGITLEFKINCMPHPTAVGQQQLAADFLNQESSDPGPAVKSALTPRRRGRA